MSKYALVVGINQYGNFSPLNSAAKDAEAMAQLLEQHQYHVTRLPQKPAGEGWKVASKQPVMQADLSAALRTLFNERGKHQEILLFFSGHGFRTVDPLTEEATGYLATSDARDDGQNAIAFNSLNKLIEQAELSSLVVLLDCCHAGALVEQQSLLEPTQATLSRKPNSCLIAACRGFEQAWEVGDHGAFTAAVLKGLAAQTAVEGIVTSSDLLGYVARSLRASGQEVIHAGMGQPIAIAHYPDKLAQASESPAAPAAKPARVFISYRSQPPDSDLAEAFYRALKAAGHEVFMAAESIRLGDNWSARIDDALERCDHFMLLLSPQSAISEMVTEEVRRARELRDTRGLDKPKLLPIRVNFPFSSPMNYDLRGYLNPVQQGQWRSPADTPVILEEVLAILAGGEVSASQVLHNASTAKPAPAPLVDQPDMPPVPIAPPELPGGQVDLASQYYVERLPLEANCYETVLKPGALIRIKAPRQMGKTSLMSRILLHASGTGCLTVPLSFQLADAVIFSDLDRFLRWFCASIGRRLKLPNKLKDYWDAEIFGAKDNCTAYFEEYLLPNLSSPLVLGLDEVDMVFAHPNIAADFMGLLRAWHESAKVSDLWKQLRLVVVHSTEVYIPMNINQSPFNVGLPIELLEFGGAQVQDLAQRHGLDWGEEDTAQLMAMVGGHPYLVRVALYAIARGETTLGELLAIAPTEEGPYGDHLRRHLWNLQQRSEMVGAIRRVMASREAVKLEPVQAFQLHSMGVVHLRGNAVVPRCDLYRRYFGDRLG